MIQRIQSLYLLAVAALMTTAVFTPLAYFAAGSEEYLLYAFSLKSAETSYSTLYMGVIVALAAILPFVTIFLFKNRMLQIRLCAVESLWQFTTIWVDVCSLVWSSARRASVLQ